MLFGYSFVTSTPKSIIKKQKILLESDILYSVRHLLLMVESGSSLINSIEDVSRLNTNSSLYFKQFIFDIEMGIPLEDVITKSIENSPSEIYTNLLEGLDSSLKTGTDIAQSLRTSIDYISRENLIKIREYGKNLNPMTMFYMISGSILPVMVIILLSAFASFVAAIPINIAYFFITGFLVFIQVVAIIIFKNTKPRVLG